jgi:hypothetical protein
MAIDTTTPRSRRALLAGTLGGLAAAVAGTLGQPTVVRAHDPDDVRLGAANSSPNATSFTNTFNSTWGTGDAIEGYADGPFGTGVVGVNASSGTGVGGGSDSGDGVSGNSTSGDGVSGYSASGPGVFGRSDSSTGVVGVTYGSTRPAVLGQSPRGNTGVQGYSGPNSGPGNPTKTGVYGYADTDAASVGVRGGSATGRGGLFSGKLAQLRLNPTRLQATHPSSGATGDFFVDASGRLWFCKGATTWVQLA